MRRLLVVVALLVLTCWTLAGCSGTSRARSLAHLIPSDSFAVLLVNWGAVGGDAELREVVKEARVEETLAALGIRTDQLAEAATFGDASGSAGGSHGMLLRGSYKSREVTERLKGGGWAERSFGRRKLYAHPSNGMSLAALDSNLVVYGTRSGVEATIGVAANPRESFAASAPYGRLASKLSAKQNRYPVLMVVVLPQSAQDATDTALQLASMTLDVAGMGLLGELLDRIGYARGMACAISREGDAFPLELVTIMKDEETARFVAGGLNLLLGVSSIVPQKSLAPSEREALEGLKKTSVDREREVIFLRTVMAKKDLTPRGARP